MKMHGVSRGMIFALVLVIVFENCQLIGIGMPTSQAASRSASLQQFPATVSASTTPGPARMHSFSLPRTQARQGQMRRAQSWKQSPISERQPRGPVDRSKVRPRYQARRMERAAKKASELQQQEPLARDRITAEETFERELLAQNAAGERDLLARQKELAEVQERFAAEQPVRERRLVGLEESQERYGIEQQQQREWDKELDDLMEERQLLARHQQWDEAGQQLDEQKAQQMAARADEWKRAIDELERGYAQEAARLGRRGFELQEAGGRGDLVQEADLERMGLMRQFGTDMPQPLFREAGFEEEPRVHAYEERVLMPEMELQLEASRVPDESMGQPTLLPSSSEASLGTKADGDALPIKSAQPPRKSSIMPGLATIGAGVAGLGVGGLLASGAIGDDDGAEVTVGITQRTQVGAGAAGSDELIEREYEPRDLDEARLPAEQAVPVEDERLFTEWWG